MIRILVVEDEKAINDLIKTHLEIAGYRCRCAYDGTTAADFLDKERFDLIILDVMLPGIDGFELMEYIAPLDIPVIFLTAKHGLQDKLKGLRLGADDFMIKPFEMMELLARIETVLRRYHKKENRTTLLGITVDFMARTVKRGDSFIDLTAKEFGLLEMFIRNKNVALFRDVLYEQVWEKEYTGDSRTVELHVQRLRRKLGWEHCLKTVHSVGYRLEADL